MAKRKSPKRVLLDASAIIGIISGDEDFAVLQSCLRGIDEGEVELIESTAILVEVLPEHDRDITPQARADVVGLLQSTKVHLIDVNVVVARKAAELRVAFGLKTWDAIHLATAIVGGADVFIGRDHKFPSGQSVEGVLVREPFDLFEDRLPLHHLHG